MTLDWSPLAIATVVLACVAVWSILQTRGIQKSEKRRTLLNGIIDWAVDVIDCDRVVSIPYFTDNIDVKEMELDNVRSMLIGCKAVDARREYVINASAVFGEDLHSAVIQVTETLVQYIQFLNECISGHQIDDRVLSEWKQALHKYARTLVQKAVKIGAKI